jgi:Ca-activated chloride channel family protein
MKRLLLVFGVLGIAFAGALVTRAAITENESPLVIVHWSNSHPMREGLLPEMAEAFNDGDHETASGRPIEIAVVACDSSVQTDDLVSRVKGAGHAENGCTDDSGGRAADPTIVTPQSSDWLVDMNHRAGIDVVDLDATDNIAETWLGIVTYRQMAECLGWPDEPIGYADILELSADERGWGAYLPCAQPSWGTQPLLAFTNPNTSTSGRNVLVSLYSMAAGGKAPGELTVDDIRRPEVVDYVKDFQQLVDHYMPGTIPLNTKINQGTRYGHFFLMPEDNLVSLYKGNEKAIAADGTEQPVPPVTDLIMIYPEEGSVLNANPAAVVEAPWVTTEFTDAAGEWIDFLREDDQQRAFMNAGFRPATGTGLSVDNRQFAGWGLDAERPKASIEPGELKPDVLDAIMSSWGAVKNPAIVTFVVDVSGSMEGEPLEQVKEGLGRLLDAMAGSGNEATASQVGLVTFSDVVEQELAPAPLDEAQLTIADAIYSMEARGETALYDAVKRGVELTDEAAGDDRATRAVVVLSDGEATAGRCLDTIVSMISRDETPIYSYCGRAGDQAIDADRDTVVLEDVVGEYLTVAKDDPVQVFFLGFGEANLHIGRILAQASGAEYQGSTEEDLASVIEELSGYF